MSTLQCIYGMVAEACFNLTSLNVPVWSFGGLQALQNNVLLCRAASALCSQHGTRKERRLVVIATNPRSFILNLCATYVLDRIGLRLARRRLLGHPFPRRAKDRQQPAIKAIP